MSDTPTPRVGEQIAYLLDYTMNEVEAVPADFARQLERELADSRAWSSKLADVADDLRAELAETASDYRCLAELLDGHDATECRENLLVLKSDLKRMEGFAKTYRLRADEAEDKLAAERALADRLLAITEKAVSDYEGTLRCADDCKCSRRRTANDNAQALAAWKEARHE